MHQEPVQVEAVSPLPYADVLARNGILLEQDLSTVRLVIPIGSWGKASRTIGLLFGAASVSAIAIANLQEKFNWRLTWKSGLLVFAACTAVVLAIFCLIESRRRNDITIELTDSDLILARCPAPELNKNQRISARVPREDVRDIHYTEHAQMIFIRADQRDLLSIRPHDDPRVLERIGELLSHALSESKPPEPQPSA